MNPAPRPNAHLRPAASPNPRPAVLASLPDSELPPPLPEPDVAPSPLWQTLKAAAIVTFILGFVVLGGVVLPSLLADKKLPDPPEREPVAQAQPAPTQPQPAPPVKGPESEMVQEPTPEPRDPNYIARPLEGPSILPKLPAEGEAYQLARDIDRALDASLAKAGIPASPLADDAEFLRRVYLDLTGSIPPRQKTIAFLDDKDPLKRSRLIDELLASEEFGEHLARLWRDVLIKRDFDNNRNLVSGNFTRWLAGQFNREPKWDKIVRALIEAEGQDSDNPAVFFILANQDMNQPAPNKLVGAVGNLFLGIQIHCAECHQHPYTAKWGMDDFWGLAAFFGQVRMQRTGGQQNRNGPITVSETAPVAGGRRGSLARPSGPVIAIPDPTNPRRTLRTVRARYFEGDSPKLDKAPYRPALAMWVTTAENPYFAKAAVNRTWAHFFARGFVNPIEDMNPENVPSHPELLQRMAKAFIEAEFDLKFLIRAICNTQAYQRTSRPVAGNTADDRYFSRMAVKVLGPEPLLDSIAVATGQTIGKTGGRGNNRRNFAPNLLQFFDTREVDDDPRDFTYGVPQILRLMNTRLTNESQKVIRELLRESSEPEKVIEGLYLTILSRRPSAAETSKLAAFVQRQETSEKGYAGIFWVLLNSAEFAVNR